MYFKLYQDISKQWRWTLYAANHRKVADSAESYWNKNDCFSGINLVRGTNSQTPVYE
ncbi:MAG: DUF1508 domain-containing protein [Alphaproteobacteria bacterium]|nr:DUF1508 domain-containing protein [Alphaproteobacteria bacterium]